MSDTANTVPAAEAGWFGSARGARFGWLHRASRPSATALVIVPPFGYEAICAHRSLRHLAEDSARAGVAAVRFDLDGTGDSAGDDLDPGRLEAWLDSIDDACDLARSTGATQLVLAGVRVGAALAALAATRRRDIAGLALINPVIRGKAFLREARALQAALDLEPAPSPADDNVQELIGFAIAPETRDALASIDLTALEQPPAASILLIERDDMPGNDALPAHLRELGATVDVHRLPGHAEMMLDPHKAVVPQAVLDAITGFAAACPRIDSTPPQARCSLTAQVRMDTEGGTVQESIARIDTQLFGTASGPCDHAPARALLLLNAGAIGRSGPNRLHVTLARTLATRGWLVLRLDQCGLGDSPARAGEPENVVYAARALDDVGAAVAWLHRQGAREVTVAGLCSGAYHAFKAAGAGQDIDRIVMINPLTFDYQPGMPLDSAAFKVTSEAQRYGASARNAAAWRKLLRGKVNLAYVARILVRRIGHVSGSRLRDAMRALGMHLRADLGSDLLVLAKRGIALHGIFAGSDPGLTVLREQGGNAVAKLRRDGRLHITVIDGADHTFTARWTQPLLLDAIRAALASETRA